LGVELAGKTVDELRRRVKREGARGAAEIEKALGDILVGLLSFADCSVRTDTKPSAILVVGVNGVGKTTTIGKLAARYVREGKRVLLCAGDTFRAAAAEQLSVWAERAGRTWSGTGRAPTPARWYSTA
jgi:fused signal recognition particle receptor